MFVKDLELVENSTDFDLRGKGGGELQKINDSILDKILPLKILSYLFRSLFVSTQRYTELGTKVIELHQAKRGLMVI